MIARRRLVAAVVVAALLPAAVPAAEDVRSRELEAIRDEIARLQGRLARVEAESRGLAGELQRTELSLELQSRRLDEAAAARRLVETSLERLEATVSGLERELASQRAALERRLADLYRLGRHGYLRLLLSIGSRGQLLPAVRSLRYLARRDGELLDRFVDTRAELAVERQRLLERQRERSGWVEQERSRLDELARLRRRQAELLASLDRQRSTLSSQTLKLADKERRLGNLLDFLAGRSPALAGRPIQQFRGALDWPVGGRIVHRFGHRRDRRYGTQVPHNGLTLATTAGTTVRSIYPGKVLFAAPFEGYGPTAVVHHSGGVFTLYAGLGSLQVRQGDILALGQPVGEAASSLYFEIREQNRPADPLSWLR